jgi:hypothetical protein
MNEKFNFAGRIGGLSDQMNEHNMPLQPISDLPLVGTGGVLRSIAAHMVKRTKEKRFQACIIQVNMKLIMKAMSMGMDIDALETDTEKAIKMLFIGTKKSVCNPDVLQGVLIPAPKVDLFMIVDATSDSIMLGGTGNARDYFDEEALEEVDEEGVEEIMKEHASKKGKPLTEEEKQEILNNIDLNKELGLGDKGISLN